MNTKVGDARAGKVSSACELKIGYVPTIFVAGREQAIQVYSRCKGTPKWEVADTDNWEEDASNRANRDGYYTYRLRATWPQAVTNKQGIRFSLQPLDEQQAIPEPLVFDVIVESSLYAKVEIDGPVTPQKIANRVFLLVLLLASGVIGMWVIADTVTMIVPAIIAALPGNSTAIERQHPMEIAYNISLIFLSILLLAVLVGEGEHYYKRVDKPGAWKLFAIVLGIEGLILLTAQLV